MVLIIYCYARKLISDRQLAIRGDCYENLIEDLGKYETLEAIG